MEHVVHPAVADLQHEFVEWTDRQIVRLTWRTAVVLLRGYWACWAAVTRVWLLGFGEPPDVAPSAATLLRRALGMASGLTIVAQVLYFIGLIGGVGIFERIWRQAGGVALVEVAILKAPSDLVMLIAPALLAAVLAAGASLRQHGRRVLVAAVVTMVGAFVLSAWIVPVANDAFRHRVAHYLTSPAAGKALRSGPNELSLTELPAGMERLYAHLPAERRSSFVSTELHLRLALPAACLAFGLLGWALSCRVQNGRCGALRTGAIVLVVSLVWLLLLVASVHWARRGVTPAFGIWGANLVLALAATAVWLSTRRSSPRSATG